MTALVFCPQICYGVLSERHLTRMAHRLCNYRSVTYLCLPVLASTSGYTPKTSIRDGFSCFLKMISHFRFSRGYGLLPFSLHSFLLTNIITCQSDKGFSASPGRNSHKWHIMAQSFTIGEIYIMSCGLFPLFG